MKCAAQPCMRPAHARGLCGTHYSRFRRTGSIGLDPAKRSRKGVNQRIEQTIEGLLAYTARDGDCRRWKGTHDGNDGYGFVWTPDRQPQRTLVHRLMHELAIGPIPEGHEVDHVYERGCRFHDCIWPPHLEAVTPSVNGARAAAVRGGKEFCRKGLHRMTPENTHTVASNGNRRCRTCENARKRRDYHRKKGSPAHA